MNSLKVLSAVAAVALVLPLASPSFAQSRAAVVGGGGHIGSGGGGSHIGGGGGGGFGGGARMGGGAAFHGGGGNFAAGAAVRPSGGSFVAGAAARPSGGTSFTGGTSRNFAAASGGTWQGRGGNWSGGSWRHHHPRGGFWPGFAAGAAIGGLGSYAYYGGGYYDDPYYYGDSYYDEPSVAVVPDSGGDSVAYCAQRYKSYDPASGTYLGYDGQRHPCP